MYFGLGVWVKWLRGLPGNRINTAFLIPGSLESRSQKSVGKMAICVKNGAKNGFFRCGLIDLPKGDRQIGFFERRKSYE